MRQGPAIFQLTDWSTRTVSIPDRKTLVWMFVQAVPLANMMLECLGRAEHPVADAALEYISCLDYVPMTDRNPQLQVSTLPAALQTCTLLPESHDNTVHTKSAAVTKSCNLRFIMIHAGSHVCSHGAVAAAAGRLPC